ncbi:hypothetical protein [Deinococcus pimensis]|uniref:hypothetical protein n=1 Tax=Deinococcus pimensis TaxID=309888 RepID=UPI000480ACFE|nr:hypothetical protein [Deinococcus pimensis]
MSDLPYLDTQHLLTFGEALTAYHSARLHDPDRRWRSLLYLVTLTPYLWDAAQGGIDFEGDHADLSGVTGVTAGEALVLDVAAHLFSGEGAVDLVTLADGLDDEVWEIVLAAVNIFRDG